MGATGAEWRRWNRWSVKASLPCSCFPPTDDRGVVLQTESVSAHVLLFNVPQDNIFQDMQTCISSQMSESCDANANVREIQVTICRYFLGSQNIFWRIVKYFCLVHAQTGEHIITILELHKNGDTVTRTLTKNDFVDSLQEHRLPLRDLRMLVKSSDTVRTKFPSLNARPSSKCYIFEIEHIRFLCFRKLPVKNLISNNIKYLLSKHKTWAYFFFNCAL